jgi:hypothetical protein
VGERLIDAQAIFHFQATVITPLMVSPPVGAGSVYMEIHQSEDGAFFDGSKVYEVTLPAPIPHANFWSFTLYDPVTRSLLKVGEDDGDFPRPSLNSLTGEAQPNEDGSVTLRVGPASGRDGYNNYIVTDEHKGFVAYMRLYSPLEAYFDKSWRPGEIKLVA